MPTKADLVRENAELRERVKLLEATVQRLLMAPPAPQYVPVPAPSPMLAPPVVPYIPPPLGPAPLPVVPYAPPFWWGTDRTITVAGNGANTVGCAAIQISPANHPARAQS